MRHIKDSDYIMMDLESYKIILSKYSITDCAVATKDVFVFIISEILTDEEIEYYEENDYDLDYRPKKLVTFLRKGDSQGRHWVQDHLIGWDTPRIGACNKPRNHSITLEISTRLDHQAFITGNGPAEKMLFPPRVAKNGVPLGGFVRGGIRRTKTIDGWAYAVGGNRTLGKFLDKDQWQTLNKNLPKMPKEQMESFLDSGFEDIDGFSETDIYTAGGHGDVWHFDGENWTPIPFPSNDPLESLCCAGDGYVYISGYQGITFKGRGDHWTIINRYGITLGFRDMVWHKDRVYCTSDYGLWEIVDDKVQRADVPDEITACSGHLYANNGVMLLAGLGGAAFCEDGEWTLLFNSSTMDTLVELEALKQ
ncbi:hypothetical protein [Gilvimarinus japonicus]|uniref:Uncharacterized protein n=1 Tax=Gilvimarinus japonicus TaxID=1796469 RepID=A0ABV7HSZ7_9GAMM